MSWIHMTSSMANADDSFHSGVTSTLRNNVLWAQRESRFVYQGIFQTSIPQGFSTTAAQDNRDYRAIQSWLLFAVPARTYLGGPEPRPIKVIVDARLSTSAGTDSSELQIAFLDEFVTPSVDAATGILFHPKAEFTIGGNTWTLYSDDTVVPHRAASNPWYFVAAAANYDNDALKARLFVRSIYLREVAALGG